MKTRNCRRTVCLILSLVMLMPFVLTFANAKEDVKIEQFEDIERDWSYEDIRWCISEGLMAGTTGTTFSQKASVTRAQFLAVLYRLSSKLGFNMLGFTATDAYYDVKDDENLWYAGAACWGYSSGIVSGYSDGGFHPNDTITREQMATFIYRFMKMWIEYKNLDKVTSRTVFQDEKKLHPMRRFRFTLATV